MHINIFLAASLLVVTSCSMTKGLLGKDSSPGQAKTSSRTSPTRDSSTSSGNSKDIPPVIRVQIDKQRDHLWAMGKIKDLVWAGPGDKGVQAVVALAPMADACTKHMPSLDETRKNKCDLAINRVSYFNRIMEKVVKREADNFFQEVSTLEKTGKVEGQILALLDGKKPRKLAEIEKMLDETYGKIGEPAPEELTKMTLADKSAIEDILAKAAKKWRVWATAQNGKVTRTTKKYWMKKYPEQKVKHVFAYSKNGSVKKNGWGTPIRRLWEGQIVTKVKSEPYCRMYTFKADSKYKRGRYGKVVTYGNSGNYQVTKCRK